MTASTVIAGQLSRSRSSDSSASSLSSTFSDIITSDSSSTTSKTHAFFASPFSTHPPSPIPQLEPKAPAARSLTADFFATPVKPPSPPISASVKRQRTIHPSRIFPSRYTSTVDRSPDFVSLDVQTLSPQNMSSHERSPSSGSESSFTSSFVETRLPTPPPPAFARIPITISSSSNFESQSSEPTPRPPNLEPTLLHFERSLLLAAQETQKWNHQPQPEPEPELLHDDDEEPEEEPHPGSIISLTPIPQFSLSPVALTFATASPHNPTQDDRETPTPTNEPSKSSKSTSSSAYSSLPASPSTRDDSAAPPTLRLLRPLGHGAFSAVWLAEDLSRVPLTLVSKKSVRDLRRRVSGRDKEREREKEREKEKGKGRESEKETRDNEKITQGDQEGASPKEVTNFYLPRRPPRNLRDGLKSMLSFSRLPKLAPPPLSSSCTDDTLYTSPSDMDLSSWNGCDLPSSPSLHLDADVDKDLSTLSRTSSIRSSSSSHSHSSFSGAGGGTTGISRHQSLKLPPSPHGDSASLSRDSSLKKFRDRVRGTRPAFRLGTYLDERHGEMGWNEGMEIVGAEEGEQGEQNHLGANLSRHSILRGNTINSINGRLVAVKMTPRRVRGAKGRRERAEEERTRVGFVREVEVLKHISHPNITPLLAHLSTSTHHILVLPYLQGGDLLGLVNNDVAWGKLGESVLRRIWYELCKAVGWMHGVGLVHRDIKLENRYRLTFHYVTFLFLLPFYIDILLTTPAFNSLTPTSPPPTLSSLPTLPAPFIKLTDFGLSRFVEIDVNGEAELLWTRCGSEAYAAPELVTGGGGSREGGDENGRRGVYDARKTDAWACGVVLYALVGRQLPFGEGVGAQPIGGGSRIGGERGAGRGSLKERRQWLMRIARGEYEWPGDQGEGVEERQSQVEEKEQEKDELVGTALMHSRGARRIVGRLLIRDPNKRARIGDLWDDSWMTPCTGTRNGASGGEGDEGLWKEREKGSAWNDSYSLVTSPEGASSETPDQQGLGHEDGHEDEDSLDIQGRNQHFTWMFDQTEVGGDSLEVYRELQEGEVGEGGNGEELLLLEEEEGEEEEGGCLFDHEGIDSITRQEVV
ncbi:kinase-like protein [Phlegmacium glaucopus]|nr:kinase-like protein [Phlegmacium glaucopus]